jgi:hypothetical protein
MTFSAWPVSALVKISLRVAGVGVGEDQLASGQARQGGVQRRVRLDRRQVDVMHIIQEPGWVDAVVGDQARQGGAMFQEIFAADARRFLLVDLEHIHQEVAHLDMDLVEQAAFGRVERIVQVEEPDLGVGERAAFFVRHPVLTACESLGIRRFCAEFRRQVCVSPPPPRPSPIKGEGDFFGSCANSPPP